MQVEEEEKEISFESPAAPYRHQRGTVDVTGGGNRAAAMGVPFLYGLVEVVLIQEPKAAMADAVVTPAAAQR